MSPARRPIRLLAGCVLVCGLAAGAAVPPASAQPAAAASGPFAAGEAAFAAGDYAAALDAFEAARDAGTAGPAVHYNIGVCQYRLGDYAAAADTFRAIAARFPRMRAVADYNLGLALTRRGTLGAARAAFARAERAGDETIARLAAAMLGRLGTEAAAPRRRVALVDVAAGRDSNIALVDELSLPAGARAESSLVEALGYVDAPLGATGRFGVDATAYWIDYADAPSYDQLAMRVGFDYRRALSRARLVLGPYYERSELGGRGFEERFGVELDVTIALGERAALSMTVLGADVDELDARYAFVAGDHARMRLRYRRPLAGGALSATYDWETNDRAAASVSPTRSRLMLGWRRRLAARWEAELEWRYRRSRYKDLEAPRTEELAELRLGVARDLGGGWQATGGLVLADNDSTDPVYTYEREVLSVGLRKVF